jgi:hypothetical protein
MAPIKLEDYAKELLDAAGLSDAEQRKAYEQFFLSNPKVREKMETTLNSLDSAMGRASAEAKRAEAEAKKAVDYYQESLEKWGQYDAATKEERAARTNAEAQVQAYINLYGVLPDGSVPTPQRQAALTQDMIDRKTYEEDRKKTESQILGLTKAAMTITAKSLNEFKREPDFDAIQRIAQEKGLNALQAFDEWAAPMRAETAKAAQETEIARRVAEAVQDANSKRHMTQTSDVSMSEFRRNMVKTQVPMTKQESFLSGWREENPSAALEKEFGRKH